MESGATFMSVVISIPVTMISICMWGWGFLREGFSGGQDGVVVS